MFTITLEKILKEFSINELEAIVFKNKLSEEHFLNLAEIENHDPGNDLSNTNKFSN